MRNHPHGFTFQPRLLNVRTRIEHFLLLYPSCGVKALAVVISLWFSDRERERESFICLEASAVYEEREFTCMLGKQCQTTVTVLSGHSKYTTFALARVGMFCRTPRNLMSDSCGGEKIQRRKSCLAVVLGRMWKTLANLGKCDFFPPLYFFPILCSWISEVFRCFFYNLNV